MTDIRGNHLYVNVSAAAARKRLHGRGLGVKKVHSAGRNQAVVIHTAEGKHLEELQSVFHNVGWSLSEDGLSEPIENLRNLGTTSGQWLREVGVQTVADLRKVGAVAAYALVCRRHSGCSLSFLWALAAGLDGRDWRGLTDEEKTSLRRDVDELGR